MGFDAPEEFTVRGGPVSLGLGELSSKETEGPVVLFDDAPPGLDTSVRDEPDGFGGVKGSEISRIGPVVSNRGPGRESVGWQLIKCGWGVLFEHVGERAGDIGVRLPIVAEEFGVVLSETEE
jgi:hypothetical protein